MLITQEVGHLNLKKSIRTSRIGAKELAKLKRSTPIKADALKKEVFALQAIADRDLFQGSGVET